MRTAVDGDDHRELIDVQARSYGAPASRMMGPMIGWLEKTVFDCPDPGRLARFYAEVLGMRVLEDEPTWVVIGRKEHMRELAFQKVEPYLAPRWPDGEHPQQLHLDIAVEDFGPAMGAVLALGAVRRLGAPETGYRVFEDPAGHPFCLVHGRKVPDPRRA
jgi:catechol 2,3-dioxygenase-like lactoylglutathione lyase family enzyme